MTDHSAVLTCARHPGQRWNAEAHVVCPLCLAEGGELRVRFPPPIISGDYVTRIPIPPSDLPAIRSGIEPDWGYGFIDVPMAPDSASPSLIAAADYLRNIPNRRAGEVWAIGSDGLELVTGRMDWIENPSFSKGEDGWKLDVRPTHVMYRDDEFLPCYCGAEFDHAEGEGFKGGCMADWTCEKHRYTEAPPCPQCRRREVYRWMPRLGGWVFRGVRG